MCIVSDLFLVSNKHDTVLNNLKEEQASSLEDLANRNFREIVVLHSKLLLEESCQMKLKEASELNLIEISVNCMTSHQNIHNFSHLEKTSATSWKNMIKVKKILKKKCVCRLWKKINTLNDNKEPYESQIEALSRQNQILISNTS